MNTQIRTDLNQLVPDTTYMFNTMEEGGKCSNCGESIMLSAEVIYRGVRKGKHLFRFVTPPHCPQCGVEILEYVEEAN